MPERREPTNLPRTLTVTGQGTASADPDLTVLSFGVVGRDPSYAASVEKLNGRVEALRENLEAAGVERARLKTTGFYVRDDRRYARDSGKHIFLGYEASHRLRLELPFDKELLNSMLTRVAVECQRGGGDRLLECFGSGVATPTGDAGRGRGCARGCPGPGGSLGRSAGRDTAN